MCIVVSSRSALFFLLGFLRRGERGGAVAARPRRGGVAGPGIRAEFAAELHGELALAETQLDLDRERRVREMARDVGGLLGVVARIRGRVLAGDRAVGGHLEHE